MCYLLSQFFIFPPKPECYFLLALQILQVIVILSKVDYLLSVDRLVF